MKIQWRQKTLAHPATESDESIAFFSRISSEILTSMAVIEIP